MLGESPGGFLSELDQTSDHEESAENAFDSDYSLDLDSMSAEEIEELDAFLGRFFRTLERWRMEDEASEICDTKIRVYVHGEAEDVDIDRVQEAMSKSAEMQERVMRIAREEGVEEKDLPHYQL